MIYIVENAVPILLATLAGALAGALFYPAAWRRPGVIATVVIAEAWFAAILAGALILAPAKADPWVMAIGTAVVIWVGFVMPALVVTLRMRAVTAAGIARDAAHWLAVMVVQAVVLHVVGLTHPLS